VKNKAASSSPPPVLRSRSAVTSREVAAAAGVSQSAVSLVFSGKWRGRVSTDTAERIRACARQLQYRPNLVARGLRMEQTGTVLAVLPELAIPTFAELHAGISAEAQQAGYSVVITSAPPAVVNPSLPVPGYLVDGVLICRDAFGVIDSVAHLPAVGIDTNPRSMPVTINSDVAAGMRQMCRMLLDRGHRRIGYLQVSQPGSWLMSSKHYAAAQAFTHEAAELIVHPTSFELAKARVATRELLDTVDRPTAIICEDDNIAIAVYIEAAALGLRIPDDLSVVGHDDLPIAEALHPGLTTARAPSALLGSLAMQALLNLLRDEAGASQQLPVSITERDSVRSR
jgi:LacI family transcriptional regulator, repressor for deo operon, udp, cdd, tsx, nupC, and nupG